MTTFWKPRHNIGPATADSASTKRLGNMVYVLWCRCDLCFHSGPSTLFTMLERDNETGELCWTCTTNKLTLSELLADGWKLCD